MCTTTAFAALRMAHRYDMYNAALPSNIVFKILCDKEGYIWCATNKGLVQFDGNNFTTFGMKSGMPDDDIVDVFYIPQNNKLWPMSYNGKLFNMDASTHQLRHFNPNKRIEGTLLYTFQNSESIKFISTGNIITIENERVHIDPYTISIFEEYLFANDYSKIGISLKQFNKKSWNAIEKLLSNAPRGSNRIRILEKGMITTSKNIFAQQGNQIYELFNLNSISIDESLFIVEIEVVENDLYVAIDGEHGGIFRCKNFFVQGTPKQYERISTEGSATSVCADKKGNIWYAIKGEGLFCIEKKFLEIPFWPLKLNNDLRIREGRIKAIDDTIAMITNFNKYIAFVNRFNESINIFTPEQSTNEAFSLTTKPYFLSNLSIKDQSHDGRMIFYAPLMISLLNNNFQSYTMTEMPFQNLNFKTGDYFEHKILFSTSGSNALYQYDFILQKLTPITLPHYIDIINDIYYDSEERIIICAQNGVYLSNNKFKNLKK